MSFTVFIALIILVSFLLILVIMVQNPKGGGLSSAFGGSGSQVVGGVQKTGDFLDKSTWTLAALLIVLILLSNITLKTGNGASDSRLLDGQPSQTTSPIPPADSTPAENPDNNQGQE